MNHLKLLGFFSLIMLIEGSFASTTEAGPLLDWLCGRNRNQPPAEVAYMPATQCETCTMTCQRQVVNYVPQTQYRTNWVQVPVTSYRPVTSSDPCSGCTVTCMRPCTTYRWQAQRVPYTSYRPVYSTVTVQRPVTSMMPATSGCSTCGVAATAPSLPTSGVLTPGGSYLSNPSPTPAYPGTTYPGATYPGATYPGTTAPGSAYPSNNGGTFSPSPIPANNPPSLDPNALPNTSQRIEIPERQGSSILSSPTLSIPVPPASPNPASPNPAGVNAPIGSGTTTNSSLQGQGIQPINDPAPNLRIQPPANPAPALLSPQDQTAQVPVRRDWDYTPVRLAVYQESTPPVIPARQLSAGQRPAPQQVERPAPIAQPNHGWRSLNQN